MFAQEESSLPDVGGGMPLLLAAELQDDLMVASNDLERLQRLLDDASESLMGRIGNSNAFFSPKCPRQGSWTPADAILGFGSGLLRVDRSPEVRHL